MLHAIICALAFAQAGQLAQPPNSDAPVTPGTATLRGHVLAADTGLPLRKAQVRITANEIRESRLATTDAEGKYEFKEVRAGRYTISASKGSYVGLSYGQQRPLDAPKPLAILDNQTVERLDFSLPRGGVITGRIVDEFGEPMSDLQISAQYYQFVQGQRRLVPTGRMSTTDDMGEFRLFGVSPGQYYLTATWRNSNPMNNDDKTAYAPTYFPGTENIAQAQRLTLAAGQEMSDLVMALEPMRATRITGTATTSDGKPMPGSIMVMSTSGFGGMMTSGGAIRSDGTFSVNGIAPGEYTLRAQSFGVAGPDTEMASMKITVSGDDITDLHLIGAKPSILTGRIVVDPAAAAALPSGLMVVTTPVEPGMPQMGVSPGRLGDDGTFEVRASPGRFRINVVNQSGGGWMVRSVRLNGIDITDTGVEIKPNENVGGIDVELTNQLTTITGLVTGTRGETLKDYSAIAFAQDRERWKIIGRYQGMGRPDQDGRFKIAGLPPGDYYVVALDSAQPSQLTDPDFLESVRPKATTFTLREGETRTVDLKLNSAK